MHYYEAVYTSMFNAKKKHSIPLQSKERIFLEKEWGNGNHDLMECKVRSTLSIDIVYQNDVDNWYI